MSVTTHGMFDYVSPVTSANDSACIMGRSDINNLVRSWTQGKDHTMLPWIAREKLKEASVRFPNINEHATNWHSATFIGFRDAILVQSRMHSEHASTLQFPVMTQLNADVRTLQCEHRHFQPVWPKMLTFVHCCDDYGAQFAPIPSTSKLHDHRLLWLLISMHVTIPYLWETLTRRVHRLDSCEGWLLQMMMNSCLPHQRIRVSHNAFTYPTQVKGIKEKEDQFVHGMIVRDEMVRYFLSMAA